jgi:intracellular sulfur oxidation DsrE/DsrF family protein
MKVFFRAICIGILALSALTIAGAGQQGYDESQTDNRLKPERDKQMDAKRKIVFHLDWDQEERLLMALENTRNLFKEISPQQCTVCVVSNGKAVNLFRKDRAGKYVADMEELHKQGVRFKACRNAMAKNKMEKGDLLEVCEIVPAGILELIDLQHDGFAYIKP